MKLSRSACSALGVVTAVHLARARAIGGVKWPSGGRDALTRFAAEDTSNTGVGNVHPIAAEDMEVEHHRVDVLEADGHTTGETPPSLLSYASVEQHASS